MPALLKKSEFLDAYSKFFPFLRPYLAMAFLGLLLTAPVGALDAVIAWFLKPFMDNLMVERQEEFSRWVPYIIVGFTVIQGMFIYLSAWVNGYVGNRITLDLRRKLFAKLLCMDTRYFDANDSGTIVFRYFNDAEQAATGLISNIKLFLTKFFSSVALAGVLLWNSWQLTIIALAVMLFIILPMSIVRKKIKKIMQKTMILSSAILNLYGEVARGNKVIKSCNLNRHMMDSFEDAAQGSFKMSMKMIRDTNWLSPFMHIVASVGVALVIACGGYMIVNGIITSGTFVSFLAALIMLYTPLKSIGNNYIQVQQSIVALGRIYEIFDTPTVTEEEDKLAQAGKKTELQEIRESVEFRDVHFGYTPENEVLKGISFTAPKGTSIALVGNSGGGKSTIVSLIPRLYEVTSGSVLIDGRDIRDYTITSLRDKIAYVFQDSFLFNTTIDENIRIGKPDATPEEIRAALDAACLTEFIDSLPDGLKTEIGEHGTRLSGGQKQRIAIARAFVQNAPIVILDEATSALDNKSEKVVQEALGNLMKNRTVFVIAHRLSTIESASRIMVINDGLIVESGTHEELMAKGGAYYTLHNIKSAEASDSNATATPEAQPAEA
jgi:subfamily B ATP-binding cassette protein MsbA